MKELDYSKIVTRNDVAYEINSEEPFSGLMTAYHPNGQLKSKTFFVNGMKDGNYLEYRVNGSLLNTRNYVNGTLVDQTSYHPNENIERYEAFKSNKLLSIQLYDENGDDDLIDAEFIPIGVFFGDKETEESKYNFGNIFKYMMNLSTLKKTDKPLYLNLIKEDGYIPGRVVFLPPKESSLIQSYEPFTVLYLDENLNPIKEGKVKRNSLAPVMFFADYDDKPLRTCLSRKDCTEIHKNSFYDSESYFVGHIQDYEIIEQEFYYLSGSFKYSTVFDFDEKKWIPNIKKPYRYFENGSIEIKYKFQDTKNIGRTEFYEDGTLKGDFDYIGENILFKTYSKSGNIEREELLNESGHIEERIFKISGEKKIAIAIDDITYFKTFHSNGQVAEIYSEKDYSRYGSFIGYDSNGNVLLRSNVIDGELDGECLIFNSDGKQLAKWFFNDGITEDSGYQNSYTYLNCKYGGIHELDKDLYKAFKDTDW